MNKLIAAIKKIRLGQILTTFMAGILLFVSTACNNGPAQAKNPDGVVTGRRQEVPAGELAVPGKKNPRVEIPGGTATSPDPGVSNTFQGGPTMNEFSDVDPRAEGLEKAASQKAQALKEQAERNVIDETGNVGENTKRILGKKGENVDEIGENLKRNAESAQEKAKGTAENFAKGTRRGTENIKENTSDAVTGANRSASQAAEDVKDSAKDLTKGASKAADEAKYSAKDLNNNASRASDKASGYFQSKINQAADSAQRNLNKAGNAVKDVVD
ncbi:MAG TPA: hypothetical protein DEV81_23905 [Cyanobacteria bacterium UBA11049]|nr:hypothetical protein [Cyanobacteria bacterium UBA11049]